MLSASNWPRAAAAALTAQLTLVTGTYAQDAYPMRPIRLIVPSSPGGGTDASARIISPKLSALLGQQIVLDYRPGAAAMIGTEAVARADGAEPTFSPTPENFGALIRSELARWAKVARAAKTEPR
jgi:tripartite-type tricarboxylate transporter receptor subunit TctC